MPVSLQPGQNARSAAPLAPAASEPGADAPFARSLARLLQGTPSQSPGQEAAAGGGTELPPPDQILPPEGQPQLLAVSVEPARPVSGPGADALRVGTGTAALSGQGWRTEASGLLAVAPGRAGPGAAEPGVAGAGVPGAGVAGWEPAGLSASAPGGAAEELRPMASQRVLADSQRELTARVGAAPDPAQQPLQAGAQPLQRSGQAAQGMEGVPGMQQAQSRPGQTLQGSAPALAPRGVAAGSTVDNSAGSDAGLQPRFPGASGAGERARLIDQPWPQRAGERAESAQQGGTMQAALQTPGTGTDNATGNDSTIAGTTWTQSVTAGGSVSRAMNAETAEAARRAMQRSADGGAAPAWQSGRSSEPLELASALAGDRLQRFAEQWSSQMNERGAPHGAHAGGAATPAPAAGPLAASLTINAMNSDSAASANAPAAQGASAAMPAATAPGAGAMPPLPSLTTMPGSAGDVAARSTGSPDAALAGSREAFAANGSGQAGARQQWGEALSRRISLMTVRNQSEARIQLEPPELGRLMVQIQISSDQASVSFVSPHAMVREALEANVPRLQDMLSEQGLDLLDVDISEQSQQQADEQHGEQPGRLAGEENGNGEAEPAGTDLPLTGLAAMSLVDDYV